MVYNIATRITSFARFTRRRGRYSAWWICDFVSRPPPPPPRAMHVIELLYCIGGRAGPARCVVRPTALLAWRSIYRHIRSSVRSIDDIRRCTPLPPSSLQLPPPALIVEYNTVNPSRNDVYDFDTWPPCSPIGCRCRDAWQSIIKQLTACMTYTNIGSYYWIHAACHREFMMTAERYSSRLKSSFSRQRKNFSFSGSNRNEIFVSVILCPYRSAQ